MVTDVRPAGENSGPVLVARALDFLASIVQNQSINLVTIKEK
jgi:hypothetical protein